MSFCAWRHRQEVRTYWELEQTCWFGSAHVDNQKNNTNNYYYLKQLSLIIFLPPNHQRVTSGPVDWQLHQPLCCGRRWKRRGGMWFCLGVALGATLGPLRVSGFLPVVWAQETPAHYVCVDVPPERLLCPGVFTYTLSFLLGQSQRVFDHRRASHQLLPLLPVCVYGGHLSTTPKQSVDRQLQAGTHTPIITPV